MMHINREKLITALTTIEPGDPTPLLALRHYCRDTGESIEDYLEYIPKPFRDEFDERQQYLISPDWNPIELELDVESNDVADQLRTAEALLTPDYRLVVHQGQIMMLRVIDDSKKLVEALFEADVEPLMIRALCQKVHEITHAPLSPNRSKLLINVWKNHVEAIDSMPKPMAPIGEDVWTFHRPVYEADASVEMPNWDKILKRMSDPIAFAAWVWGVYSGQYEGRQILWLHGRKGQDGKSAISRIIGTKLFGNAHKAISNAALSGDKRFVLSFFETCALVLYPDASNRMVLLTELFKSVANAGDDPVLIERKNKQAYSTYINARLWINSNFAPVIPDEGYATSRLLYINITPLVDEEPDPKVKEMLVDQLPGFLHYAKQAYEECCERDYLIKVNEKTQRMVNEITGSFHEIFENAFEKLFVKAGPDDRIQSTTVQAMCKTEGITWGQYRKFKEWLDEFQGVVTKKHSNESGRTFYYGLRPRTPDDDIADFSPPTSDKPAFGEMRSQLDASEPDSADEKLDTNSLEPDVADWIADEPNDVEEPA